MNAVATSARWNDVNEYIRRRLEGWGREFALDRTFEPNGITILWLLMRFGGRIPHAEGGPRPLVIDEQAYQVERIVAEMALSHPVHAAVLRASYGGRGREKFERRELAERLARTSISVRAYFAAKASAIAWVTGALIST